MLRAGGVKTYEILLKGTLSFLDRRSCMVYALRLGSIYDSPAIGLKDRDLL